MQVIPINSRARQSTVLEKLVRVLSYTVLFLFMLVTKVEAATTTVAIDISDIASTTSLFTVPDITPGVSCTYQMGKETGTGYNDITGGIGGSCNTNDWVIGDNTVRVQPVFSNPITESNYKGWVRTSTDTFLIETFTWNGEVFFNEFASTTYSFSSAYDTRILSVSLSSSTPATTTVNYFIDTTEFTGQYDRPDSLVVYISSSDSNQVEQKKKTILPLSTGSSTKYINLDETLPDGDYTASVMFWNLFSAKPVFTKSYITINFTISGGVLTSQGTVGSGDGRWDTIEPKSYKECGVIDIAGCLYNAGIYLFVPNAVGYAIFEDVRAEMAIRIPFVYVAQVPTYWEHLWNTSQTGSLTVSASTSIGNFTFISEDILNSIPLSAVVRNIIGILIWFMLSQTLYYRVRNMFNTSEKTT